MPTQEEQKEYLLEEFASSAKEAEVSGKTVVRSTPTTLLLDLDTGAALDAYEKVLKTIQRAYPGIVETERWASKSKRGTHVVLTLPEPMPVTQRLLLQACLGSDPIREMLGLKLFLSGEENPIMLFRPKL